MAKSSSAVSISMPWEGRGKLRWCPGVLIHRPGVKLEPWPLEQLAQMDSGWDPRSQNLEILSPKGDADPNKKRSHKLILPARLFLRTLEAKSGCRYLQDLSQLRPAIHMYLIYGLRVHKTR